MRFFLVIAAIVAASTFLLLSASSPAQRPENSPEFTALEKDFLQTCVAAPVEIKSENDRYEAMAYCMGRIRGMVDGNLLTMTVAKGNRSSGMLLWCLPEKATDGDLYAAVLAWVVANNEFYAKLKAAVNDKPQLFIVFLVSKVLRETYPCTTM